MKKQLEKLQNADIGLTHAKRVWPAEARRYAGMYPVPEMGHEIVVAFTADRMHKLYLANVSGHFYLRSYDTARDKWTEVFKVYGDYIHFKMFGVEKDVRYKTGPGCHVDGLLCGNGNFYALTTREIKKVDCPHCVALLKAEPGYLFWESIK